jgi:hypothetical protein
MPYYSFHITTADGEAPDSSETIKNLIYLFFKYTVEVGVAMPQTEESVLNLVLGTEKVLQHICKLLTMQVNTAVVLKNSLKFFNPIWT